MQLSNLPTHFFCACEFGSHFHLLDVVAVPLLHVLPQRAAVVVGRAAPVLAHVPLRLLVHALDVDLQLALVAKSLKHTTIRILIYIQLGSLRVVA